jgi:tight adherence protein B
VSETTAEPLKSILQEVVAEARLGTPVEEVLQTVALREDDRHLNIVASAIGLHARHGGSLVEILDSVTETIEEEDRLRREIRSATADGRLSATVLLAMPPVSLALVSLLSPDYAAPLVTEPLGRAMSVTAVVLGVTGWRWLRVLSNPRVSA